MTDAHATHRDFESGADIPQETVQSRAGRFVGNRSCPRSRQRSAEQPFHEGQAEVDPGQHAASRDDVVEVRGRILCQVKLNFQGRSKLATFAEAVRSHPEVLECSDEFPGKVSSPRRRGLGQAAGGARMRRVCKNGFPVGAPSHLPNLWRHALLRLFPQSPRK